MDSFLTRSAKKLEQALGVPRPWELTPATSVGYQMATGEGSLGERARKGTAQFMGRYVTNIKPPYAYTLPSVNVLENLKSVARDRPSWADESLTEIKNWPELKQQAEQEQFARDILFRELFDLPSRQSSEAIVKTGPKTYTMAEGFQPAPQGRANPVLGGVYTEPTENGYKYSDVWDLVSPEDAQRTDVSSRLRKLISPILRPATVKGEVSTPKK